MSAKMNSALNSYKDYGYNSEIEYADPHRLIQMLFEGALKRIAFAKGAIQRKQIVEKGKFIGQAVAIVDGLRASLDKDKGGEIAVNLEALYDYISRQLVTANLKSSEAILDEVSGLLLEVKSAWDAINAPAEVIEPVRLVEDLPVVSSVPPVNTHANRALKAYAV
jgi:flagellar protein FliS